MTLMKPTIEIVEFGLVCKRADEIKSNRAIMQDVWKSICEARIIIADLTELNPNVMYELGIAHTLGKETIIIYRKDKNIKFPFDISHIRRIEYENTPVGGTKLVSELKDTLRSILTPEKISG
jgi:nucleoside 2-deoxyribosyltransferase